MKVSVFTDTLLQGIALRIQRHIKLHTVRDPKNSAAINKKVEAATLITMIFGRLVPLFYKVRLPIQKDIFTFSTSQSREVVTIDTCFLDLKTSQWQNFLFHISIKCKASE